MLQQNPYSTLDHLIFYLTLYLLFQNATIINILENVFYYFYLNFYGNTFTYFEKLILIVVFNNIKDPFYITIKYHLLIDTHFHLLLESIEIDFNTLIFSICLCLVLLFLQLITINSPVNIKRKIIHLFLFLYYYNPNQYKEIYSKYFIFILLVFNKEIKTIYKSYLSPKDNKKYVMSHIYILFGCFTPMLLLNKHKYRVNLITTCFLDGFASVPGQLLKKKEKTFLGFCSGVFFANLIYYLLNRKCDYFIYFVCMGIVEYYSKINDNLVLPYVSVIYLKMF